MLAAAIKAATHTSVPIAVAQPSSRLCTFWTGLQFLMGKSSHACVVNRCRIMPDSILSTLLEPSCAGQFHEQPLQAHPANLPELTSCRFRDFEMGRIAGILFRAKVKEPGRKGK